MVESTKCKSTPTIVNLYIVASPLQYLCAERIAETYEKSNTNICFYVHKNLKKIVDAYKWSVIEYLPWPRLDPKKGFFGKHSRTLEGIRHIVGMCSGANVVRLHAWTLLPEFINYLVNSIQKTYPEIRFGYRLIPDGTLHLSKRPQGKLSELGQYVRKINRLFNPSLRINKRKRFLNETIRNQMNRDNIKIIAV